RLQPSSTLFPYTTLFRSIRASHAERAVASRGALAGDRSGQDLATRPLLSQLWAATRRPEYAAALAPSAIAVRVVAARCLGRYLADRKSTRLNSSHDQISY